ncbi:SIMPL domain-containing protein [Chryseolinea lacunae]|uniref:SIMPL domain-containing protein n=1 Tax=Chryseolinea lacunae TaxID=2801331 RepID=A0ABS1KZY1_9BACT|nr:SIMPL domain-containing protein [Chryseolinea lacunae]MBL0745021.1 SIMPL domain-containing protein [Chryseolinea lacunae]
MRFPIFFIFLFSVATTFGQDVFKGEHFIEVPGSAQLEIEPNEIFLFIRLREFEENRNKVQLEKLDQDFMAALKAAGVDRKNLTLADAGSQLGKLGRKEKDAFREKSYELKLTSAAELEKFLVKLEPVKVEQLDLTRVSHTDIEKYKIDLKVKALQAAQAKAQTLLKSIGAEAGKPLMVRDWDNEPVQPVYANAMFKGGDLAGNSGEPEIGFKKIKLKAQIVAQFEIK